MKKIFFLLLLFSSILAKAQYTYQIVARNLTAPDNTTSANIIGSGAAFHNLTWNVSGTVSSCSVRVDGSTDGITWGTGDIIGATTCTSNGNVLSTSHIVNYVRINLVTLTGAGATFTANASGYITQPSGGGTVTSLTCGTGITCSPGSPITGTGTISASGSGGAIVQLETHTASNSATLNFTTCFTNSSYHTFKIKLKNLVPATNTVQSTLRMSTDGGATYDATSGIYDASSFVVNGGGTGNEVGLSTTSMQIGWQSISNTASSGGVSADFDIFDPANGANAKVNVSGNQMFWTPSSSTAAFWAGSYHSTVAVNAFQILFSSGNITSGVVTCYGVTP